MWEFIRYCFFCMGTIISSAFGYNPEYLTWETGTIGVLTLIILGCAVFGIIWLISFVCIQMNRSK